MGRPEQRTSRTEPGPEAQVEETPQNRTALAVWLRRLGPYALALLLVAAAVLVRAGLTRLAGPGLATYVTFYPAVMLAALVGGWGPGLLATVTTAIVVDYWVLPPAGLWKFESPADAVGLLFFSIASTFICVVAELYRGMRFHLQDLVRRRTAALSQANDQLHRQSQELARMARSLKQEKDILQSVMEGARNSHLVYPDRDVNSIGANEAYAKTSDSPPPERPSEQTETRLGHGPEPEAEAAKGVPLPGTSTGEKALLPPVQLPRFAWLPIPILLLVVVVLLLRPIGPDLGLVSLLPVFNFIFLTLMGLLVAVLAARSYLAKGSPTVLFMGAGTLALSVTALLASLPVPAGDYNTGTTTWYLGNALAGFLCLLSAYWLQAPIGRRYARPSRAILATTYAAVLLAVTALNLSASHGLLPTFFVKGVGPTALRETALGIGLMEFAGAALLILLSERRNRCAFLHWYALGLVLNAVGQFGAIHFNRAVPYHYDSLLTWVTDGCIYLGGIYWLVAVIAALRQSGNWTIPLTSLRETYDRYTRLVDASPDAVLVLAEDRVVFANPGAARLFGVPVPGALLGLHLLDLVHPAGRSSVKDYLGTTFFGEKGTVALDVKVLPRDGPPVDVELIAAPVMEEGQPAVQVVLRDISERKQTEERAAYLASYPELNPNPVFEVGADGTVRYANRAAERVFPELRTRGEGHPILEGFRAMVDAFQQGGSSLVRDVRVQDSFYQQVIHFLPYLQVFRFYNVDITERTRAEEALRRSEEKHRIVADNTYDWEFWLDPQGRFLYTSPSCERITGYAAQEFMSHPDLLQKILHPQDLPAFLEHQCEVPSGRPGDIEFRVITRQGAVRWIHHLCQPVYNKEGRYAGSRGSNRDITERKRAEEALQKQAALIDLSPDGIMVLKLDGEITFWSKGAEALYGWTAQEAIGRQAHQLFRTRFPEPLGDIIRRLEQTGRWSGELVHTAKDGRTITVQSSWLAQCDEHGNVVEMLESNVDITERKRAEMVLREAHEKLQTQAEELQTQTEELRAQTEELARANAALRQSEYLRRQTQEITRVGSFEWNIVTGVNTWTTELEAMYGLPPGGFAGTQSAWEQLIYPEDRAQAVAAVQRAFETDETVEAEWRVVWPDGSIHWLAGRFRVLCDPLGKPLSLTGLNIDITERKHAEEALRVSEEKFRRLFESNMVGIAFWHSEGQLTLANQAFCDLIGCTPEEVAQGKVKWSDVTPPEILWRDQQGIDEINRTGVCTPYEKVFLHRDGRRVPILIGGARLGDWLDQGVAFTIDITERKRAEEMLRESERKLTKAQEITHLAYWEMDLGTNRFRGSEELYRMYNTDADMAWDAYKERVHPDDRAWVIDASYATINEGTPFNADFRVVPSPGEIRYVHAEAEAIRDSTGRPISVFGTVQDITERKRAEEALRETRDYLESLLKYANAPIIVWDPAFTITQFNHAFERLSGYEAGEVIGKSLKLLFPPGSVDESMEKIRNTLTGERWESVEIPILRKDGGTRIALWNSANINDEKGELLATIAQGQDITARKQAEEALRQSEDQLRVAATAAEIGMWHWTPGTNDVVVTANWRRLFGVSEDATVTFETWRSALHAEDRDHAVHELNAAANEHREFNVEYRIIQPDGSIRWVVDRGRASYDASGRPIHMAGVNVDITERKQAEEALRESEAKLAQAQALAHLAHWEVDVRTNRVRGSQELYRLFELEPDVALEAYRGKFHPQDRERVVAAIEAAIHEGRPYNLDYRIVPRPGVARHVHAEGEVRRDDRGRPLTFFGTVQDITERKQMEEELSRLNAALGEEVQAKKEQLQETVDSLQGEVVRRVSVEDQLQERSRILEAFFQHTITPLAVLDRDFHFVRVNQAYAEAAGKDPEGLVGQNYFSLYPDEENRPFFEQVVRTQEPYHAYARALRWGDAPRTGTRYWNCLLTPLLDTRGQIQSLVLNLEDVTARQKAFDELEQRARQLQKLTLELTEAEERERARMAEILHDDLQQVLAATKFQVSLLSSRVKNDADAREIAGQARDLLTEAIAKSRSLSHELSSPALAQSDLSVALEWLVEQMQQKHGFTVHLETDGQVEIASKPLRILLYKAAQEMLFNAIKHAGVPEAKLRLRRQRGCLRLSISDRGRGFDPAAPGFKLGFGLLNIRERIELLGGRMKIRSAPGKGSMFFVVVPNGETTEDTVGVGPRAYPTSEREGGHGGGFPNAEESRLGSRPRLRVLLADDHEIVREGFRSLLSEEHDVEVVGEAANGREAVDLAHQLRPDVIIMDMSMPVIDGDAATRQIKALLPNTRVIAVSMYDQPEKIEAMCKAGAERYVLKTAPSQKLLAAIRGKEPDS